MSEGVRLYNSKNASALNYGTIQCVSLETQLIQDNRVLLLPANACYVQNLNANATVEVFINDMQGVSYFIEPNKDKFFTGENIYQIFLKNIDGSNNISANELQYSFYKTGVFVGVD